MKTSLAPGSQAVGAYLVAVVQDDLNALGFDLAGYWCTTCMCNIGLLRDAAIATTINENDLITQQSCRGAATSRAT